MKRRPQKHGYRSDRAMAELIIQVRRDAAAILPMYHRLHSLGEEPGRGESVRISGSPNIKEDGSVQGYVPDLAINNGQAEHRRKSARWVDKQMEDVAHTLFIVRQGLEHNVGPSAGYRQPEKIDGSEATVDPDEFRESVRKQGRRLRAGAE